MGTRIARCGWVLGWVAAAVVSAPGAARATDGLCWQMCETAFRQCQHDHGCRLLSCPAGSTCQPGGHCSPGGGRCGLVGCDATVGVCYETFSACMDGCRDWLVALRVVEQLDIDPFLRASMVEDLKAVELEVDRSLARIEAAARQRLGAYAVKVEKLLKTQQVDAPMGWALQDMARKVQAGLSGRRVRAKVMAAPDQEEPEPEVAIVSGKP